MQNVGLSLGRFGQIRARRQEIETKYASAPDSELIHGKDAITIIEEVLSKYGVKREEGARLLRSPGPHPHPSRPAADRHALGALRRITPRVFGNAPFGGAHRSRHPPAALGRPVSPLPDLGPGAGVLRAGRRHRRISGPSHPGEGPAGPRARRFSPGGDPACRYPSSRRPNGILI